ncbi:macrophage mannose receptor 1-like isoform X1 [Limulus polyphemus]|uniref:Macrophage mannose receptor 1-like isoform X1 n=1 Tax=Limulus polyphemus TaxID=6850 RepID=A0ABM1BUL0_LIMPO|nr:macrophage mannose receptor 1-like isoform X1 [Limulus polyphemus]
MIVLSFLLCIIVYSIFSVQTSQADNTTDASVLCPDASWDWILHNGFCFYLETNVYTWHDAERICSEHGSHLASIHSMEEQRFIFHLIKNTTNLPDIWIGLNALGYDEGFEWSDSTPVAFLHWAGGEPNNWNGQEKCANVFALEYFPGMWNDKNCNSKTGFVCKKSYGTVTTPVQQTTTISTLGFCPSGWYTSGNKCFFFGGDNVADRLTWFKAQTQCKTLEAELVSIHSQDEQDLFAMLLSEHKSSAWLGLQDFTDESQFYWTDNSPTDFTAWAPGQPKPSKMINCVEMMHHNTLMGKWRNVNCEEKLSYFCQKYKDKTIDSPAPEEGLCSNIGWYHFDTSCYKLFVHPKKVASWYDAEKTCQENGGHLVSITHIGIHLFLRTLHLSLEMPVWIGMKKDEDTGRFLWVSKWPMLYTNWGANEPRKLPNHIDTCVMKLKDGTWKVASCRQRRGFICEVNSQKPPELLNLAKGKCPRHLSHWKDLGGEYCYFVETNKVSWPDANLACFQQGGSLVSIHSKAELIMISLSFRREFQNLHSLWSGLVRKHDGGFIWSDSRPVNFVFWADNEPDNLKEQCVQIAENLTWYDKDCSLLAGYICMSKKVLFDFPEAVKDEISMVDTTKKDQCSKLQAGEICGIFITCVLLTSLFIGIGYIIWKRWKTPKDFLLFSRAAKEPLSFDNEVYNEETNFDRSGL